MREAFERLYAPLAVPTVVHDVDPTPTSGASATSRRATPTSARCGIAPSRGLAHFEQPEKVAEIILAAADGPGGAPEGRAR